MPARAITADWHVGARVLRAFSSPARRREAPAAPTRRSITTWSELPPLARLYVTCVIVLGGAAIADAMPRLASEDVPLFAVLTILSIITSGAKVSLPVPRSTSTLTVCYVIDFTTFLLFGQPAATLTAAAGAWSQCVIRREYRTPAYQTWFSVAALALTVRATGAVYALFGRLPGVPGPLAHLEAPLAAAAVFFVANSMLVAAAVALSTGQSTIQVWANTFLWSWPGHLVGFGLALAAAAGIGRSSFWLLPIAAVSLVLTYDNFKAYVARFTDSLTDPLTGLSNVRSLVQHVERELSRSRRDAAPLAVLLVDLDGFKAINDTHGHSAGDLALRQVALCLQQSTRTYDLCARYGGDEFVLAMPGCGADLAERKAASLRAAVAALRCEPKPGVRLPLRVSVGVGLCPDDGETLDALLAAADARMFENKAANGHAPPADRPAGRRRARAGAQAIADAQLQEQLLHAQKLAAIGQLTGGVVHDFNNVLTAILGYSELLSEQIGPDKPMGRDIKEIVDAAQHGAALTHQLLAFSRHRQPSLSNLDLNEIVTASQALLRRLLAERIVIVTRLTPDLHPILGDATELEQVLINLAVNARDAMPDGGELRVETHNVELDAAYAEAHPGAKAGAYVALSVADTGVGMAPDVRARIFDPFFTTKGADTGTGLGLTTVSRIVVKMDGYISVDSTPGRGTSFRVYFPEARASVGAPARQPVPDVAPVVGRETILLVEDEAGVRTFAARALRRHGYTVLEADSGEAAISTLERYHGPVHLLVSDIGLPGIDGHELAARAAALRPCLPVLFTTGHLDRLAADGPSWSACLDKPFTTRALLAKARALLDDPLPQR